LKTGLQALVKKNSKTSYLSLKWQALIGVSLILIASFGFLTFIGKKNLEENYFSERERIFKDRQKTISASLANTQLQLMRLAGHMQGQALLEPGKLSFLQQMQSVIDRNWDQLNFEWGVDSVALFSAQEQALAKWGRPLDIDHIPGEWLRSVRRNEEPAGKIWCPDYCLQMQIVPILQDQNTEVGTQVYTTSLSDAILFFQTNTSTHVGILVSKATDNSEEHPQIPQWGLGLSALSGMPTSLELLKSLSQDAPFDAVVNKLKVKRIGKKLFEISFIALALAGKENDVYLAVLDDVTFPLAELKTNINYLILVSSTALLLTELVLLAMLWRPMLRLQTLVNVLPSLAGDSRRKVPNILLPKLERDLFRSEIHNLFDATIVLTQTLEELDKIVDSRTQRLKSRSQELLQERNFITSLLNNVHVVILTQDSSGQIKLANSEGERLFSRLNNLQQSQRFVDLLPENDRLPFVERLGKLQDGDVDEIRHEFNVVCAENDVVHMEWYHTCLPESVAENTLILSVGMDLTARKVAENNLAWLADHDPLTELYNRRRFQMEFARILKNIDGNNTGALIFFDIDQFKTVNDTSGHPMGDQLLRDVAHLLRNFATEDDIIARLGGDEFAIIKQNCNLQAAEEFAERFCSSAKSVRFFSNGANHQVSLSIGIALFPEHGTNIDEIMASADLAMYRSKATNNARSGWQVYSANAPDKAQLHHRVTWKRKIEQALEQNYFVLYFQPILNIKSGKITHYESLLRMRDENGAICTPNQFISVAEATGLIYEIDMHVVRLAVNALAQLQKLDNTISLSVNLSARAVANKEFLDLVENACEGILSDKSKLIFELTETSAVEDVSSAVSEIENFRNLGYKFALDDFGVGFSSWYYLRQLPVDFVKIDGSFVRNLAQNIEDRLFVKAINDVAQGLGKFTIAEFVEDDYALSLLTAMGVNYAQGYELGKPQPLANVITEFASVS